MLEDPLHAPEAAAGEHRGFGLRRGSGCGQRQAQQRAAKLSIESSISFFSIYGCAELQMHPLDALAAAQ